MQYYNEGRIKPTDKKSYVDATTIEMAGNDCIAAWMMQNIIRHTWVLDEVGQHTGVDIRMILNKKLVAIDLKYQTYDNTTSFVYEISQRNGTNWITGSQADYILWCVTPVNIAYLISMDALRTINPSNYKQWTAKSSGTTFCMVPFKDVPIESTFTIDFSSMKKYFKQNKF